MQDGYNFLNAIQIHQSIYNNSFHSTIKASPNKVHFGRSLSGIIDTFSPTDVNSRLDVHTDYYNLCSNLNLLYNQIHQNLINFQNLQNSRQHHRAKLRKFQVGDIVYLSEKSRFRTSWNGPYKIISKTSDVIVQIQILEDPDAPIKKVHINRLRLSHKRGFPPNQPRNNSNVRDPESAITNTNAPDPPVPSTDDPEPEVPDTVEPDPPVPENAAPVPSVPVSGPADSVDPVSVDSDTDGCSTPPSMSPPVTPDVPVRRRQPPDVISSYNLRPRHLKDC